MYLENNKDKDKKAMRLKTKTRYLNLFFRLGQI